MPPLVSVTLIPRVDVSAAVLSVVFDGLTNNLYASVLELLVAPRTVVVPAEVPDWAVTTTPCGSG